MEKRSAREILKESKIENMLRECFKKCALGRVHLRKCVVNAMNMGLTKENILVIINDKTTGIDQGDMSMCAIVAIGQMLGYEEKREKLKPIVADKEGIENKLKGCLKKCSLARRQLRKCVVNALDAGLTTDEILVLTDAIVGGLGEKQVSLCAIIAVDEVLKYEENVRAKPIDIVKERELTG